MNQQKYNDEIQFPISTKLGTKHPLVRGFKDLQIMIIQLSKRRSSFFSPLQDQPYDIFIALSKGVY